MPSPQAAFAHRNGAIALMMAAPLPVSFAAGAVGEWTIDQLNVIAGEGLATADRLSVSEGIAPLEGGDTIWILRGVTSNTRYAERSEVERLAAKQERLGRSRATRAALIPIRKDDRWWSLAQDDRRAIIEKQSQHIQVGMEYLPAIARRLHHCRDLCEPFDFLTWFEYAPEHEEAFDELLSRLRATDEWHYVNREVDIRLSRRI